MQTDLPVREKIFLLLDATQTSLGGAKAKFPQYYEAYYELVVGIIFTVYFFCLVSFVSSHVFVLRILVALCLTVGVFIPLTRSFFSCSSETHVQIVCRFIDKYVKSHKSVIHTSVVLLFA